MQGMNKIEQQYLQVDVKKLIDCLESGKKSAHMMRSLILQINSRIKMENDDNDQHQDHYKASLLDHHSMECLDTYSSSLSMLKNIKFDGVFSGKRKLEDDDDGVISEESTDDYLMGSSQQMSNNVNGRREGYKRSRKFGDSSREEEVSHLTDDGFAWRKYGQKLIYNSHYPRHYYRCTHKNDQKCQATKQVQQVSDKPTKYKLIYHFNHTCNKDILETSPFMIDFPEDHSSSRMLSFHMSNQVDRTLFPSSAVNDQNSPSFISSNNHSFSQDTTSTTTSIGLPLNSESYLSIAENNCSSTACSVNLEEDDYTFFMADFSDFILPDWWTN